MNDDEFVAMIRAAQQRGRDAPFYQMWSSHNSDLGLVAILDGFAFQRELNKRQKRATTGVEKGFETRYLRNRATFAATKAAELPEARKHGFADRKVWSA
jgi:hypothetical protein